MILDRSLARTSVLAARAVAGPAMTKSATSLLLGAALATVFFLLYTSVCRDLGDGPPKSSPPRWAHAQEQGTATVTPATRVVDAEQGTGRPGRQEEEVVAPREEKQTKDEAASRSGHGGGSVEQQQNQRRIVMPTSQQVRLVCLSSPCFQKENLYAAVFFFKKKDLNETIST